MLNGQWIILNPSTAISRQACLELAADVADWLGTRGFTPKQRILRFSRRSTSTRWVIRNDTLFVAAGSSGMSSPVCDPGAEFTYPTSLTVPPLRHIHLAHPMLTGDRRWRSAGLPTAQLLLGSALEQKGFQVSTGLLPLPASSTDPAGSGAAQDLTGFTLFEDVLPEMMDFLNRFRERIGGLTAAGGPLVTLNPLEAAYHLPGIDLLVRGEADTILPQLLNHVQSGDIKALFQLPGFLLRYGELTVISDLHHVHRPRDPGEAGFSFKFLRDRQLQNGLEMNFSRGCRRGCRFCSKVQGKTVRCLPATRASELLTAWKERTRHSEVSSGNSLALNINDDDILQDPAYAATIFSLCKKHQFRLWGIQTAPASFFSGGEKIDQELIKLVADRSLYVRRRPLLWIGSDAFIRARAGRLGKWIPTRRQFQRLLDALEENGIDNYHYWIVSDYETGWEELIEELDLIRHYLSSYQHFNLLPHAPFLVPYSTTPIYRHLIGSESLRKQIRLRRLLPSPGGRFDFPLVQRVDTPDLGINRLLENEPIADGSGFLDFLKEERFREIYEIVYQQIKKARLQRQSSGDPVDLLASLEKNLIEAIARLLPP